MKILLHICCAPCSIYPVKVLRMKDFNVVGFFYKQNIHPYKECIRRQEALQAYSGMIDLPVIYQEEYDLEGFLQKVVSRKPKRCFYCYHDRLRSTALIAKDGRFDYFTTTLLYSRFQEHGMVKSIGESIERPAGVPFYYNDFRVGWKDGVNESKSLQLYRQRYCGCIYSIYNQKKTPIQGASLSGE